VTDAERLLLLFDLEELERELVGMGAEIDQIAAEVREALA